MKIHLLDLFGCNFRISSLINTAKSESSFCLPAGIIYKEQCVSHLENFHELSCFRFLTLVDVFRFWSKSDKNIKHPT
jgi:hypothetical protein